MKLLRFKAGDGSVRVGLLADNRVLDLTPASVTSMTELLEQEDMLARLPALARENLPHFSLEQIQVLAPVERQEIWAAGVTYLRSKKARMVESDFSATAYDRVYEARRPELFFKSQPEKVSGPGAPVGIRADAKWNVPEPELALVITSRGQVVGYTVGNDMSARDIEGENLLYLPQAKIYRHSCALGPYIRVGADENEAREWMIDLRIERNGQPAFTGQTSVAQIKRSFRELAEYLFRSQDFPNGAVLLTGTGIVPPDDFTLAAGDQVAIDISGIGMLRNSVVRV